MAARALLVHHLFPGEHPLGLEGFDRPAALREDRMTDLAVAEILLVQRVREGNRAARSPLEDEMGGAPVVGRIGQERSCRAGHRQR